MRTTSARPGGEGFTLRVRTEVAALRPERVGERRAVLAGLVRSAGHLTLGGAGGPRLSLEIATPNGVVARSAAWLLAELYGVRPRFRRRSKVGFGGAGPRYEVVVAERVRHVLEDVGALGASGALDAPVPARLLTSKRLAACLLRGAFLGGGWVATPGRTPHLEFRVAGHAAATGLVAALARLDIQAAAAARLGGWRVAVKSGEAIGQILAAIGAHGAFLAWEEGRIRREVRADAVRLANADTANLRRSAHAAVEQARAVAAALARCGWDGLPEDLVEVARLRLEHPQASLAEIGALLERPVGKGAVLARLRRVALLGDSTR